MILMNQIKKERKEKKESFGLKRNINNLLVLYNMKRRINVLCGLNLQRNMISRKLLNNVE